MRNLLLSRIKWFLTRFQNLVPSTATSDNGLARSQRCAPLLLGYVKSLETSAQKLTSKFFTGWRSMFGRNHHQTSPSLSFYARSYALEVAPKPVDGKEAGKKWSYSNNNLHFATLERHDNKQCSYFENATASNSSYLAWYLHGSS